MIAPKEALRRVVLRLLKATAFDTTIRHHWCPERRLRLNSFQHKGYWYHGRQREGATMETIARVVKPGDVVIEVGAHIGYLTVWFSHLVGDTGKVVAFEPSPANRAYLDRNVEPYSNVTVEQLALADYEGDADFFVDDLTGQNNSLIEGYEVLLANSRRAGIAAAVTRLRVEVTTIDAWCARTGTVPDFVKIDVEGAEEEVLKGARKTLEVARPKILVEVTQAHRGVFTLLEGLGYRPFDEELNPVLISFGGTPNYFWLPQG